MVPLSRGPFKKKEVRAGGVGFVPLDARLMREKLKKEEEKDSRKRLASGVFIVRVFIIHLVFSSRAALSN